MSKSRLLVLGSRTHLAPAQLSTSLEVETVAFSNRIFTWHPGRLAQRRPRSAGTKQRFSKPSLAEVGLVSMSHMLEKVRAT